MLNPLEVLEKQNDIIRIQSEIIDELFLDLMQYITAEEADRLPVVDRINRAAEIRREIE